MHYFKVLIGGLILLTSFAQAQTNPDFFVENGTCKCPDADFGDTGTVTIDGEEKTFTKRTRADLDNLIFNNQQDPEIALTCTSGITNMENLFLGSSSFNQNINHWDVSNVTTMQLMFSNVYNFNQPLDNWDTSNVTNMALMFSFAFNFNQPIGSWDVSNVEDMGALFTNAFQFNQPLNDWDVSNVKRTNNMFVQATSFNQPLSGWNVSGVEFMEGMFESAYQFDQDLSSWVFNDEVDFDNLVSYSGISQNNYELLMESFNNQNLTDKFFTANLMSYCNDLNRNELISQKNWNISGDVKAQCNDANFEPSTTPFVTTWSVTQDDLKVDIFTSEFYDYDFTVDWGDGTIQSSLTSDVLHTYASSGTYSISITGVFPHFNLCKGIGVNACENASKLNTIEAWGNQKWRNMHSSFRNATNVSLVATDIPDLSNVSQMNYMFSRFGTINTTINDWNINNIKELSNLFVSSINFNQALDNWDVSNVVTMENMFSGCDNFDQPLNTWDVSSAINMRRMFAGCDNFNQPLNTWDVSSVERMGGMFSGCDNFNQSLNNWDVLNVTNMAGMFLNANSFDQPLNNWDVSNVKNMFNMFAATPVFNQPLDAWNVSNVEDMRGMFANCDNFNQPLNTWDVSSVERMRGMFNAASLFNEPLNTWDVSNVVDMDFMFGSASSFNQDISMWCVEQIPDEPEDFSTGSPLLEINKPNWGAECNLSIEDNALFRVVVYPNPASDYIYISANQNDFENLQIIDTSGKMHNVNYTKSLNRFDVSGLVGGIYFLRIFYADNQSVVKKLVIK